MSNESKISHQLNLWGSQSIPFFFILDFELKKPILFTLDAIPEGIFFDIGVLRHYPMPNDLGPQNVRFDSFDEERYKTAFTETMRQINLGNSYLTNVTQEVPVKMEGELSTLFINGDAKHKLLIDDELVVFSPEPFVRIRNGRIYSYPMKGTILATKPNAREQLMADPKEAAEHATIVDLIRNDLSMVSENVTVTEYRYMEKLQRPDGDIFQTSSCISGLLAQNYAAQIGTILCTLLPAGSISGAPKKKTVDIIKEVECRPRGYYTGVFGYFDGDELYSSVMIRCIQKNGSNYYFHSGGGITSMSKMEDELEEIKQKAYVPVYRDPLYKGQESSVSRSASKTF